MVCSVTHFLHFWHLSKVYILLYQPEVWSCVQPVPPVSPLCLEWHTHDGFTLSCIYIPWGLPPPSEHHKARCLKNELNISGKPCPVTMEFDHIRPYLGYRYLHVFQWYLDHWPLKDTLYRNLILHLKYHLLYQRHPTVCCFLPLATNGKL